MLWHGARVRAKVLRRLSNGKVRVEIDVGRWRGGHVTGRMGPRGKRQHVTVESWQVLRYS